MTAESQALVLIAGTDEADRRTLVAALGGGFRILEASSGREALEMLARRPEIVLLALDLPDINAHEVSRRIKANPLTAQTAVVHVCAGGATPEDRAQSLASGAERFLERPLDSGTVASTVSALLRARRLERTGALNEQCFRVALRGSPIMVWNQDRDLRYTWVYNLLPGFESTDPVGKTDAEIFTPAEAKQLTELKRRVLECGHGARQEMSFEVGGGTRYYDINLEPLRSEEGEIVGLTGAAIDISDHRRLEGQMREAQKLESIGVLAGGIAHDFNNLLTGILGNASLALDSIAEDDASRDYLDAVIEGAERAADLTNQLLAYAGKGQYLIEPVDLSRLIEQVLNLARITIPKTTRVHLTLRRDLPPVLGDSAQLQQLFMNIILNAGEAIGKRTAGTIRINSGTQELSQYYIDRNPLAVTNNVKPGPYVYAEVRDTGCGMDAATMERIFEPCFTTKVTGRGLGLAAVQGIVRAHNGTIELYSAPGRGTTFKVLLPAEPDSVVRPEREDESRAQRGSGTILVADVDGMVRELARSALERYGYTVLEAEGSQAAGEILCQRGNEVSAVIFDGSLAPAELASLPPKIAVVVSSGYPESEIRAHFQSGRVPVFVQKPYTATRLAQAVKQALDGAEAKG